MEYQILYEDVYTDEDSYIVAYSFSAPDIDTAADEVRKLLKDANPGEYTLHVEVASISVTTVIEVEESDASKRQTQEVQGSRRA